MPSQQETPLSPNRGRYTLRDLYGEMGMSDLRKMVHAGREAVTKEALVDELVRSVPLEQSGYESSQANLCSVWVPGGGRKGRLCCETEKAPETRLLLRVPVALAVERSLRGCRLEDHLKDQESLCFFTSVDKRAALQGIRGCLLARCRGKGWTKRKEMEMLLKGGYTNCFSIIMMTVPEVLRIIGAGELGKDTFAAQEKKAELQTLISS
ncbi:hypothetical protein EJB05_04222 [Eragrostis curvula]|uniref:Uncharacterized protein n=1 Tax=Eragrostis curvula TaxID=38414 RepID=A0A5J9W9U1_9POAL|nr:hypothetical protein EJB05_04222 [Eragrostis curvula]